MNVSEDEDEGVEEEVGHRGLTVRLASTLTLATSISWTVRYGAHPSLYVMWMMISPH